MTGKEFINKISHDKEEFLKTFLDLLRTREISFCIIGGLAVNAYAEPVVSLDLDIVVVSKSIDSFVEVLRKKYTIAEYPNSINISAQDSDLRVQIQTDSRYQDFIMKAQKKDVLGYEIPVASINDVLQGKIWAATDETRRPSKRQKDLADILRLVETNENLISIIPDSLKNKLF